MPLFPRVSTVPELRPLSPTVRRSVVARCRRYAQAELAAATLVVTVFLGPVFALAALFAVDARGYGLTAAILAGAAAVLLLAAAVYRALLIELRCQIRATLARLEAAGRPRDCIVCRYDLRATQADRCPECDTPVELRSLTSPRPARSPRSGGAARWSACRWGSASRR